MTGGPLIPLGLSLLFQLFFHIHTRRDAKLACHSHALFMAAVITCMTVLAALSIKG
jgi:hypothetical protein